MANTRSLKPRLIIDGAALTNSKTNRFTKEMQPNGYGIFRFNLRLNFAVTIGNGAGAISEGLLKAVKGITLKAGTFYPLNGVTGRALYKWAAYLAGSPPRMDTLAAATATYSVDLPILFADPRLDDPTDTVLDSSMFNSMELQIELGSVDDLFTAPGTATVAVTVDLESIESDGPLPAIAKPIAIINLEHVLPVDANSATEIDLPREANLAISALVTHENSSGSAGVSFGGTTADDVKETAGVYDQDGHIAEYRYHEMIQNENKNDAGLESVLAGIEVFDFVKDGSLFSSVYTGNKSSLKYKWTNKTVAANDYVSALVVGWKALPARDAA